MSCFDTLNEALEDSLPPEAVLTGGDVNRTWPLPLWTLYVDMYLESWSHVRNPFS